MTTDNPQTDITLSNANAVAMAGAVANDHAARGVIADFLSRKAMNTVRRHAADLTTFADYLTDAGAGSGLVLGDALARFADAVRTWAADGTKETPDAAAWAGVTWGLVSGFVQWQLSRGDAIGTVNLRLSTVKTYAGLATQAGALTANDHALIRTVKGYSHQEAKRVDDRRDVTRRGDKKANAVRISDVEAKRLKSQPDTPQGRRDALLMCLLLDHGLRVGELAALRMGDLDLKTGELSLYRPKVDLHQTHKLTADTLRAAHAYIDSGDAPIMADSPLLRGSRKGGALTDAGMTERAITGRVRTLGEKVGLDGASAHDCRHYWATFWAARVDVLRLQEAGGWSSLAMPRRYVEASEIANDGMA